MGHDSTMSLTGHHSKEGVAHYGERHTRVILCISYRLATFQPLELRFNENSVARKDSFTQTHPPPNHGCPVSHALCSRGGGCSKCEGIGIPSI